MKKLLSGIVAIVVLMALATNVKAATMGAAKTVEQGGTVTVTINVSSRETAGLSLKYDTSKVTYKSVTSGLGFEDAHADGGVVTLGAAGGSTTAITFTFTANEGATGKAVFTVVENDMAGETTPAPVEVEIVEKSTDNGNKDENSNETTDKETEIKTEKVNDQGKVIKKLPKTGTSYVLAAALAVTVIGSAVLARKITK